MVASVSTSSMLAALDRFTACQQKVERAEQVTSSVSVTYSTQQSAQAFTLFEEAVKKLGEERQALSMSFRECTLKAVDYWKTATPAEGALVLSTRSGERLNQEGIDGIYRKALTRVMQEPLVAARPGSLLREQVTVLKEGLESLVAFKKVREELLADGARIYSIVQSCPDFKTAYDPVIRLIAVRAEEACGRIGKLATGLMKMVRLHKDSDGGLNLSTSLALGRFYVSDECIDEIRIFEGLFQQVACFAPRTA